MNQATIRAAIVHELNGITGEVEDVTVTLAAYPNQPVVISAYDVWPVWVATRPVTACINETDWLVLLALPGADAQTWSVNGDALVATVEAALDWAKITRYEPVQILVGDGASVPAIQFTLEI
jgi:hypothetical protein